MKVRTLLIFAVAALLVTSCGKPKKPETAKETFGPISLSTPAPGDSSIYGLCCDGTSDTVLVLLPNGGGDPIRFNIRQAVRNGRFFGSPKIGDWCGIIPSKENKHVAVSVIDLDEVKGTWTYQVLPKLKDINSMSKASVRQLLSEMPDSVKEAYMVPREYGFTLARQGVAKAVGYVQSNAMSDDESPVEYPKVPFFTEWHAYNGKIILVQGHYEIAGKVLNDKEIRDTLDFVYMQDDSLVLRKKDRIISFHRQTDAQAANAKARAAAQKQEKMMKETLK